MLYFNNWCSVTETEQHTIIKVNSTAEDVIRANSCFTHELSKQATQRAVEYLGPKPVFCMSGGIDSQAAYQLWDKQYPIEVVIFKFANDLNLEEVNDAVNYVTAHNIDYKLISLDIERFLSFNLITFARSNKLLSPQFAVHAFFLDHLKSLGYTGAVFGGNGFFVEPDRVYFNLTSAQLLDLENYSINSNFNVIPSFLSFDQDLCLKLAVNTPINFDAMALEPDWHILPEERQMTLNRETRYANKISSYQNLNLAIVPQSEKKHGFEQIKDYYASKYNDLWTFDRHFRWPLRKNRSNNEITTTVADSLKNKILYYSYQISKIESGKNLLRSLPGSLINRQLL